MEITLLAFAHARDSFGFSSRLMSCSPHDTPRTLLLQFAPEASVQGIRVALDCEYVTWDTPVGSAQELAFIPPVSGG